MLCDPSSKVNKMLVSSSRTLARLLAQPRQYTGAALLCDEVLHSTYPPVPIPSMNTADYCLARCDHYAAAPAMECTATGKMLTYAAVNMMSRQFGSQLLHSGNNVNTTLSLELALVRVEARRQDCHLHPQLSRVWASVAGQSGHWSDTGAHVTNVGSH